MQWVYVLNDEGGLLFVLWLCGGWLVILFVYLDEVWIGVEYQVVVLFLFVGCVDDVFCVECLLCCCYDGIYCSLWNEIECGNYYVWLLVFWVLLFGVGGVQWDVLSGVLFFVLVIDGFFCSLFIIGMGWGCVEIDECILIIYFDGGVFDFVELYLCGEIVGCDI